MPYERLGGICSITKHSTLRNYNSPKARKNLKNLVVYQVESGFLCLRYLVQQ